MLLEANSRAVIPFELLIGARALEFAQPQANLLVQALVPMANIGQYHHSRGGGTTSTKFDRRSASLAWVLSRKRVDDKRYGAAA
jgi:hypothetical protein